MKATFDNADDFLAELQACAAVREENGLSTVRATISVRAVNAGVTAYRVVCGFHDNLYVYEAVIECGEDAKHGSSGLQPAMERAQATVARVRNRCDELKVEFRGGAWSVE